MNGFDKNAKNRNLKFIILSIIFGIVIIVAVIRGVSENGVMESMNEKESAEGAFFSEISAADIYQVISDNSSELGMEFDISEDSIAFINEHPDFFPGNDDEIMSNYVDYSVKYRQLDKNIEDYDNVLVSIFGEVIDIEEHKEENFALTYVHVIDNTDYENFVFIYLGELKDVYKGDYVDAYLLPLGMVSFENMEARYTNAAFCAGAFVHGYNRQEYNDEYYY